MKYPLLSILFLFCVNSFAQPLIDSSKNKTIDKKDKPVMSQTVRSGESIMVSQPLNYHAEIPNPNTYKIIKNLTGIPIPNSILEKINMHRRFDVDYTWVVDTNIEILIYYVNKKIIFETEGSGK
jgi:hypothetical protein